MASKRGGKRRNAGRKKKAITVARELALEQAETEAEASLAYVVSVRKDKKSPKSLRFAAAVDIMDRVWGKAKQRQEVTGPRGGPIKTASDSKLDQFLEQKTDAELERIIAAAANGQ